MLPTARRRCDISSKGAVLPGCNDAEMGLANSEASPRHPGRDFVVALFIDQKIGEDQKRKKGLRCKTSWFSVHKYVMTPQKKVFANQSVGFRSQKNKQKQMVTPGAGHPPSDAIAQTRYTLQRIIESIMKDLIWFKKVLIYTLTHL